MSGQVLLGEGGVARSGRPATAEGDPIYETVTRAVSRSRLADDMIVAAGAIGLDGRDLAPGAWQSGISQVGRKLFNRAVALNTGFVTEQVVVGYHFSHAHRLPAGRLAGGLVGSRLGLHGLNFGVGLVVDVGHQAWLDYDNPYLTTGQFAGRLGVAAVGSTAAFFASVAVASLLGPPGWVVIGAGIGVAIIWDTWAVPWIYQNFGLNPERDLAPLQ